MSEAAILGKFPFSHASPHELDWTPSHFSDHSEVLLKGHSITRVG